MIGVQLKSGERGAREGKCPSDGVNGMPPSILATLPKRRGNAQLSYQSKVSHTLRRKLPVRGTHVMELSISANHLADVADSLRTVLRTKKDKSRPSYNTESSLFAVVVYVVLNTLLLAA